MAVNGEGFFKVALTDGSTAYTRNGEFKLDSDGYIVTNTGAKLHGYMPDTPGGIIVTGATKPLQLPTGGLIDAKPTTGITMSANLDSSSSVVTEVVAGVVQPIDVPVAGDTIRDEHKKFGTTVNAYDELGNAIPVTVYFIKTDANTWEQVVSLDGNTALATQEIVFNATDVAPVAPATVGEQAGYPVTGTLPFEFTIPAAAAPAVAPTADLDLNISYGTGPDAWTLTQFGSGFSVFDINQDGYSAGELTSISTAEDGIISARYSNGTTQEIGQVALNRFRNVQGLNPISGGYWGETAASGNPIEGQPQSGRFGQIKESALEESNVDLTAELVNMIVAQRSYQANAQTIKTQDQVLTTLVNLR
jgi:flagellar hook protein FlgE